MLGRLEDIFEHLFTELVLKTKLLFVPTTDKRGQRSEEGGGAEGSGDVSHLLSCGQAPREQEGREGME